MDPKRFYGKTTKIPIRAIPSDSEDSELSDDETENLDNTKVQLEDGDADLSDSVQGRFLLLSNISS